MDHRVLVEAQSLFTGSVANGIFSELVKKFGPFIAEVIFKWIISKQKENTLNFDAPTDNHLTSASLSKNIGPWIALVIENNREEIRKLILEQLDNLIDLGIKALKGLYP